MLAWLLPPAMDGATVAPGTERPHRCQPATSPRGIPDDRRGASCQDEGRADRTAEREVDRGPTDEDGGARCIGAHPAAGRRDRRPVLARRRVRSRSCVRRARPPGYRLLRGDRPPNPTAVPSLASTLETLRVGIVFAFVATAVLGVASIVLRFRRAASPERRQLRWLVVVAVLSATLLVGAIGFGALGLDAIGDPLGVALILMVTTGLPASAGIALLKHHLHGIEVVANRAIVYGSMAATITAVYAAIVAGVGATVGRGDRPNVIAAVAATAVAAVVFQPARRRAQKGADRVIYGDRASPYELLATFTERLDDAALEEVLPRMTALIAEGTGAERVRVWLRAGNELRALTTWPPERTLPPPKRLDGGELPTIDEPAFPVRHGGDVLGAITV